MDQKVLLTGYERAICNAQKLLPLLKRYLHLAAVFYQTEVLRHVPETMDEYGALISEALFNSLKSRFLLFLFEQIPIDPIIKIVGVVFRQCEGSALDFT